MVHLGALPGTPLHDAAGGVDGIIDEAEARLAALQAAGFDAVMFGNENDRPYELKVDVAVHRDHGLCHRAAARRDHGAVRRERAVGPDGDAWRSRRPPGARFVREIFTGTYASRHGPLGAGCRGGRALCAAGSGRATW